MKQLVLLGAGHAHVHVLKSLAENPLADVRVTLISPYDRQVYSGMLPGWVAGHYQLDDCVIPLAPLIAKSRVNFHQTAATHIDFQQNEVHCQDGSKICFDLISIDTGPIADLTVIPGAIENAISIRPIESFIASVQQIKRTIIERVDGDKTRVAFVGAGAGGIELALALQHAFSATALQKIDVTLISAANTLPGKVGPRLARILAERGINLLVNQMASRIEKTAVHLQSGMMVEADIIIAATGATAAPWLGKSGLQTDGRGFVLVNDYLQSVSHEQVFAAGDCATMLNFVRPKSGVYAVRAGPPIARNLRRYLRREPLEIYKPQARSLYLVSTGNQYAIASWGNIAIEGRWVWRWKDKIDREFMAKYALPKN